MLERFSCRRSFSTADVIVQDGVCTAGCRDQSARFLSFSHENSQHDLLSPTQTLFNDPKTSFFRGIAKTFGVASFTQTRRVHF